MEIYRTMSELCTGSVPPKIEKTNPSHEIQHLFIKLIVRQLGAQK